MPQTVGVLSVQGDFEKHIESLSRIGVRSVDVRSSTDLLNVDRLIIPGGESTTVGLLLDRFGLGAAIQQRVSEGMPIWGTCMGMILMASKIEGREQYSLNLLNITVRRNAFGAQIHSFEDTVNLTVLSEPVLGVFIRAPVVTECRGAASPIGSYQGKTVAVLQGNRLGTSFHPELTDDTRLHQWFCRL